MTPSAESEGVGWGMGGVKIGEELDWVILEKRRMLAGQNSRF